MLIFVCSILQHSDMKEQQILHVDCALDVHRTVACRLEREAARLKESLRAIFTALEMGYDLFSSIRT